MKELRLFFKVYRAAEWYVTAPDEPRDYQDYGCCYGDNHVEAVESYVRHLYEEQKFSMSEYGEPNDFEWQQNVLYVCMGVSPEEISQDVHEKIKYLNDLNFFVEFRK